MRQPRSHNSQAKSKGRNNEKDGKKGRSMSGRVRGSFELGQDDKGVLRYPWCNSDVPMSVFRYTGFP